MKLGELIEKLERFNCEAFKNKEITHVFQDKMFYSFKEDIKNIAYDPRNDRLVIITDEPKSSRWDSSEFVLGEE